VASPGCGAGGTNRGVEIETRRRRRLGEDWGGVSRPRPTIGGEGQRCKLLQRSPSRELCLLSKHDSTRLDANFTCRQSDRV